MDREEKMQQAIQKFRLPRYHELPTVELYLDQVTLYLHDHLSPLGDVKITSSMVSNYVKHKLIQRPVKKRYTAEQLAELFFIAVAKNVLPLNDLKVAIKLQRQTYSTAVAYDYFVCELENVLAYVFGLKENLDKIGHDHNEYKKMLRSIIMTVCYKVYIDMYFADAHASMADNG